MSTETRLTGMSLEAWAGEIRVNLIRLLGLILFYANHLIQYHFLKDDAWRTTEYHNAITALVIAWGGMVAVIHIITIQRPEISSRFRYKPWMKYAITVMDLLFIYSLTSLHPDGARGPLALLLFLVIAAAPVRFSLRLIYVATLGAMLTYVVMIGTNYMKLGSDRYYAVDNVSHVPRPTQAIMLLSLGGAGLLAGQVVRQARRLATKHDP